MFAIIAKELGVKPGQVESAVTLLDEGNTVPFIARFRKEVQVNYKMNNCELSKNALNICAI